MQFLRSLEKLFALVALLVFTSAIIPLMSSQSGNVADPVAGDPVMQVIVFVVFAITAALLAVRYRGLIAMLARSKPLLLLLGFAVLSVVWSKAPDVTLRRSMALIGTSLFGFYLATRYSLMEQLKLVGLVTSIVAVLSAATAILMPSIGVMGGQHEGAWRGVFMHKNELARLMVLGAASSLLISGGNWFLRCMKWGVCILSVALIVMSTSVTAQVAAVILLAIIAASQALRWNWRWLTSAALVGIIACGVLIDFFTENAAVLLPSLGRDGTLTGRTEIWNMVFSFIYAQPLLGYGYSAFWLGGQSASGMISTIVRWAVPHSHNGFLDLWLDLGAVGFTLFILSMGLALRDALLWTRATRGRAALWPLAYLSFMILYNLTESAILKQNSIFWVLYVSTSASLSWSVWRYRRQQAARAQSNLQYEWQTHNPYFPQRTAPAI
jgi:exopolysaccharide production protein ExoQ